jgi:formylglycine-generating enzyme required for sulfatase activity
MNIKSQLLQLLVKIPSTQTFGERRALLTITGFDYLNIRLNYLEKSNLAFCNELIEVLFSEGADKLLEFLTTLADSEFIGLEVRQKLNDIIAEISTLKPQQWNSEFTEEKSTQPVSIVSTPNRSTESLEQEQDTILPIPSIPGIRILEFTFVEMDAQGKEIKRHRRRNHCLTEDLGNGVTLEMVYIPGGEFCMGSPESEGKRYSNERPQHSVTVKPFLMSKYPITQAQWREVASLPEFSQKLKLRPSRNGGKSHPISQVSWFDAVEFCVRLSRFAEDRLSRKTGRGYRLPTEAEWEYACRAATTTPFHFGETITSDLANYDGRYPYRSEKKGIYRQTTTPVDSFQVANPFGLFDMHGLVWEWCLDHWHENYNNAPINGDAWLDSNENQTRVMRGGSWRNDPSMCRSSYRFYKNPSELFNHVGFRVVYSL